MRRCYRYLKVFWLDIWVIIGELLMDCDLRELTERDLGVLGFVPFSLVHLNYNINTG